MSNEKTDSCFDYSGVELCLGGSTPCCDACKIGEIVLLAQWVPLDICPALLHTAYPYFLTFYRGGRFAWLREKNIVDFQCPQPNGGVIVRLSKKTKHIILEVLDTGKCRRQKPGEKMELVMFDGHFCYKAFDALFPYANSIAAAKSTNLVREIRSSCPGCEMGRTAFLLRTARLSNG